MRKLTLAQWVDVAELIAAAGVIVSLLLVVYSIERNTAAMQGGTENLLSDRSWTGWDGYFADLLRNSDLRLSEQRWEQLAGRYDAGFWAHVKASALQ